MIAHIIMLFQFAALKAQPTRPQTCQRHAPPMLPPVIGCG
jgi:hypothetical protein